MTPTVLVPLDGSPLAARALPYAKRLVARRGGRLVLAQVRLPALAFDASGSDVERVAAAFRAEGVRASSLTYAAPPAAVADMLRAAVVESRADLIVMSTHGRGGLRRTLFGSVADRLIRYADVPVLLIPPECHVSWQERGPGLFLVPLDGSPLAETALSPAVTLARQLNAELMLVRAVSPALHTRYRDGKLILSCADFSEIEDAWRYLSKQANESAAHGCPASIKVLVGSPATALTNAARTEGADLIAMTTHGRGGLGRLLLGSVADGVVRRSHVPILLARSGRVPVPTSETEETRDVIATAPLAPACLHGS